MPMPLADAIRELRRELLRAMEEGSEEALQFRVGPIDLELQVQLSQETVAKGEVKVWVVSLGADATRASGTTHTLKLTLEPVGPHGKDVQVAKRKDRDPSA